MFKLIEVSDKRIDFELAGCVDAEMMGEIIKAFEEKIMHKEEMKMLYKIEIFEMPTAAAVMLKLVELPRLLRLLNSVSKIAVVADEHWLRKVAEFEGACIPGLEIKGFTSDATDDAERWLSEVHRSGNN